MAKPKPDRKPLTMRIYSLWCNSDELAVRVAKRRSNLYLIPLHSGTGQDTGSTRFLDCRVEPDNDKCEAEDDNDSVGSSPTMTGGRGILLCHSSESWNPGIIYNGGCEVAVKATLDKTYYVYILASGRNGTLYIGVTNDLTRRVYEHRNELIAGFTKTYHIHALVYFEQTNEVEAALRREKQLKWWLRKWKLALIESVNPEWKDLWEEIA